MADPASPATATTEYRILALYRFMPLVSLSKSTSSNNDSVDIDIDDNINNNNSEQDMEFKWDEAALMAHPERHPTLRKLQSELLTVLRSYDVKGTLLLAPEGINGTICYPFPPPLKYKPPLGAENNNILGDGKKEYEDDDPVARYLKTHPQFGGPELRTRLSIWKDESSQQQQQLHKPQQAFHRLKIKIKAEIVTLGLGRPLVDRKPVLVEVEEAESAAVVVVDNVNVHVKGGEANVEAEGRDRIANMDQKIIANDDTDTNASSSGNAQTTSQNNNRHASNQLADPLSTKGKYLSPAQWDEACRNPNVLVIDTRNTYEIEIGTFESAVDPRTRNFSEFPEYLEKLAKEYDWSSESSGQSVNNKSSQKKKPPPEGIAMFCTGGIRCEKATSYAIQSNIFPKELPIYHLEGGILAYLDDVAKRDDDQNSVNGENDGSKMEESANLQQHEENGKKHHQTASSKSTFHGECFVFDKRVALKEGLKPSSTYTSCHGCRGPIDHRLLLPPNNDTGDTNNDSVKHGSEEVEKYNELVRGISNLPSLQYDCKTQKHYLPGLTCPRCHDTTTRESLERFAQRERQMEICAEEGKSHFQDQGGG